jgi:SPOR domain
MKLRPAHGLVLSLLAACPATAEDSLRPAELPPSDFRGQQYVDSQGCKFVRAGNGSEVLWIPRVSRDGKRLCDARPSGKQVSVLEEGASTTVEAATPPPAAADAGPGGYFVAVGSFGVTANADKAEARLRGLDYGVVRGRVQGGSGSLITIFAGPFADSGAASQARQNLRLSGFPDAIVIGP